MVIGRSSVRTGFQASFTIIAQSQDTRSAPSSRAPTVGPRLHVERLPSERLHELASGMIVRRFLLWARTAGAGQRAEAVGALARAYLATPLSPEDRWEAETALTALLDDSSLLVWRAMAHALADALGAPRPVMVALANDQSDIAALVLSRSPVLTDADLIDCAALGDDLVQTAVALRRRVSIPVAAALAEIAAPVALTTLADNPGADIPASAFRRLLERHGADATVRES